jgi:hypothetical protein
MKLQDKQKTYQKQADILRYGAYDQKIENQLVQAYCEMLRPNLPTSFPSRYGKFDPLAKPSSLFRLAIRHGFFLRVVANAGKACDNFLLRVPAFRRV